MEKVEENIRVRSLSVLFLLMVVYFFINVLFAIFTLSGNSRIDSQAYIRYRILLPNAINVAMYAVAYVVENARKVPYKVKNYAISLCMMIMIGGVTICHGHFVCVWIMPSLAIMYCTMFNDRVLNVVLLILAIGIDVLSFMQIVGEHPENFDYYMQNLIVCGMLVFLFFGVSVGIQLYNDGMNSERNSVYKKQLEYMSKVRHDALTGIYSRTYLVDMAKDFFAEKGDRRSIVVAMIDIDNFKTINDTFGHEKGDDVLKYLGNMLRHACGDDVIFARYGGEEFVAIFRYKNIQQCRDIMEGLRLKFQNKKFDFTEDPITFSTGLACAYESDSFEDVLKRADIALYESKNSGKNVITCKI